MNDPGAKVPKRFAAAIAHSKLTIYDPIEVGDLELWIPTADLHVLLDQGLRGTSLAGLPLRTRSRVVKELVCRILGYPVPASFKKTRPRFPGQAFDTYIQKSNNLQVWNEELVSARRYAIIQVSDDDVIIRVRVVTGDILAKLDTTGTLTQKYQARCIPGDKAVELVSPVDTSLLRPFTSGVCEPRPTALPVSHPRPGELLPISALFGRLRNLIAASFEDTGHVQERTRGAALHGLVCQALGYKGYQDDGRFPDVRHQLLEVKLQTSPTIDLGLVRPNSTDPLDLPRIEGYAVRHCDVRYAIFYARTDGKRVTVTHFFLVTGERFFTRFPQFQGKVLNKKLQIPLPGNFFSA